MPKAKLESATLGFESGRSSTVTVEHTARTVKYYNVAEHEMESIALLNSLQIGAAGVGTLFVSMALADLFAMIFAAPGTGESLAVKITAEAIPALACYALVWAFRG